MSHRAPAALLALALSGCFLTYDANDVDRPPATAAPGTVALGDRCLLDGECGSGACAPEGICCDRACSGECEACNGVGTGQSAGNCGTLTAGAQPHAPHAACATDLSSCGGSCNGVAATCAYPLWQCRNQTCTGSTQENPASCDGAGRCPEASTTPCAPYACGGVGCRTGCILDTACSPGNWCDASGSCVAKLDKGGACTAANQCRTGLACAPDGTCCDRACTGQCEACTGVNTGAAAGTCGTITAGNPPQPGHTACTSDGTVACEGSCNGTLATACAYPATQCRPASCTAGTQAAATACNGGSCPVAITLGCTPFVCGATACKTSCTDDGDCVSGDYCVAPSCLAKKAPGVSCGGANECASGNCVDGVCCGTTSALCNGCNACNVPGKLGTCWPVPAGSDPHDACTTARCQTTCNGLGATCTPGVTKCNGRAPLCTGPGGPGGYCGLCGSTSTICLVGQLCTTADTSGECKAAPRVPLLDGERLRERHLQRRLLHNAPGRTALHPRRGLHERHLQRLVALQVRRALLRRVHRARALAPRASRGKGAVAGLPARVAARPTLTAVRHRRGGVPGVLAAGRHG